LDRARVYCLWTRAFSFSVRNPPRKIETLTASFEVAKCDLKQFGDSMRVSQMVLIKPVEPRILILRGVRVLLDSELAELYGVQVKRLNEQVKRNAERFPQDFMFQLSPSEDKIEPRRAAAFAICIHRTRSNHGSNSAQHEARDRDECVRGASFCPLTRHGFDQWESCCQVGRTRAPFEGSRCLDPGNH
jgi:ORF6N domain